MPQFTNEPEHNARYIFHLSCQAVDCGTYPAAHCVNLKVQGLPDQICSYGLGTAAQSLSAQQPVSYTHLRAHET